MFESELAKYLIYGEDEDAVQAQEVMEEVKLPTVHGSQQQDVEKESQAVHSTGRNDALLTYHGEVPRVRSLRQKFVYLPGPGRRRE